MAGGIPPLPGVPLPGGVRIKVSIEYTDGTKEEVESSDTLNLGIAGLLMIPKPRDSFVIVNLREVKRVEAVPSSIAVVRGAN